MNQIAEKIHLIESLGTGQDATVRLLDKIVHYLAADERRKLAELRAKLHEFEARHALNTTEFQRRFAAGELGDDMDFFEWEGIAEMADRLTRKLDFLRETGNA